MSAPADGSPPDGSPVTGPTEEAAEAPKVGVDEWVARHEERRQAHGGLTGAVIQGWDRVPPAGHLAILFAPFVVFGFVANEGNLYRYGLITLIYALLALGLNVVVGFAGLLDLGYIAFFGVGAYAFGIMASGHSGHHLPAELAVPIAVAFTALVGLLLGLTSWRVSGDYLAIVTLFFLQAFVIFVNNANGGPSDWSYPFVGKVDITGGANGLDQIDPLRFFGYSISTTKGYYFYTLISLAVLMAMLFFVNRSRTGRAWRSLREDPLAAEVMSIPVNRLKLLAFVFGAAIAGYCGTIFGSVQSGAFPGDYDVGLLITIYAIAILGGLGSIGGVVIGALIVNGVPELLRSSENARLLFYGALVVGLFLAMRPWYRPVVVIVGTIAFGFVVHGVAGAVWPRGTAGHIQGGARLAGPLEHWVLLPTHPGRIGGWAYFALIAMALVLTLVRGWWRTLLLIPTLYLAAFVWENELVEQVSGATRLILLGALLVVIMNVRPSGIFGTARVEVV
ncbi:MAG TPA: branched-chain amino acid ABC transporter permease [Gaiellaceae bacterium]|nr:branched-chain amino acid ABC transporter permease [Gaiellaceae bacterium]